MLKKISLWLVAGACGLLAACAIITVNVYFPEKDVKQAYKSLDELLLRQGEEKAPAGEKAPAEEKGPAVEPKVPADKPQSRLFNGFSLVSEAWGAENLADTLAVELASMPEVVKAYEEMKARLDQMKGLHDSGAVGENVQGLITVRDTAKLGSGKPLVDAENANRKTVIIGMARAILKINKQPETKDNLNQVLGKAAASYADIRREAARPGWWIQLPNNRWVQK